MLHPQVHRPPTRRHSPFEKHNALKFDQLFLVVYETMGKRHGLGHACAAFAFRITVKQTKK
jgi:hypothetical protein